MLKHFQIGRRANFPVIFLVAVALLFGAAFAILKVLDVQTLAQNKNAVELFIAVVGVAAAFVHFLYVQHHQDTQMFVSLFEKFNTRYNDLNEKLNAIILRPTDLPLLTADRDTLYDYFNLCVEEHLFYEAGYIDEMVWQAWLHGMKQYAKDDGIRRLWEEEMKSGSYYRFKLSLLDEADLPKRDD